MPTPTISVIIPTINEAQTLPRVLDHVGIARPPPEEIIVVDGGSDDDTKIIAETFGCRFFVAPRKHRATQLNFGAQLARGKILCFLHADTYVPSDFTAVIIDTLRSDKVALGAFKVLQSGPTSTQWLMSLHHLVKSYYGPLIFRPIAFLKGARAVFGDQVLFCRQADFMAIGGFNEADDLMEEGDFVLRMTSLGRTRIVDRVVETSDRRVRALGWFRAHAVYFVCGFGMMLGLPKRWLAALYPSQDVLDRRRTPRRSKPE